MTCKFVLLLFCYFLVQLHQEGDDFVWYCSLRTDHRVREASRISFRYGAVAELIGSHRQVRVFHAVAKKEQKEKHKGAVKATEGFTCLAVFCALCQRLHSYFLNTCIQKHSCHFLIFAKIAWFLLRDWWFLLLLPPSSFFLPPSCLVVAPSSFFLLYFCCCLLRNTVGFFLSNVIIFFQLEPRNCFFRNAMDLLPLRLRGRRYPQNDLSRTTNPCAPIIVLGKQT